MTTRAARLARLRARFVEEALVELAEMERLVAVGPAGDARRLRKLVHDLRGAGGSYGFPDVTAAAAELEAALLGPRDPGSSLAALGEALRAAASVAASRERAGP